MTTRTLRPTLTLAALVALSAACGGSTPPPEAPVKAQPAPTRTPPPAGPTRTDFKTIAQKLMQRCITGGWISKWRSTAKDVDQARPKVRLRGFEDKTAQGLDPEYLNGQLEKQMRTSGIFDIVSDREAMDFYGQGKLLRLAERTAKGDRVSVYTATLDLIDPATDKVAYSCEATVQGEM